MIMSSTAGKYLTGAYDNVDFTSKFDNLSSKAQRHKSNSSECNKNLAVLFSLYKSFKRRRLRSELNKSIIKNNYSGINRDIIDVVVKNFIESLNIPSSDRQNFNESDFFPMSSIFYCKCGCLFYNREPTTLPCGHTQCKICVDEFQTCRFCGLEIDMRVQVNRFLVELISRWCKDHYQIAVKKQEATKFMVDQNYEKALEALNEVISLSPETDFHAYNVRSEVFSKLGQHKKALEDAQKSCSINYQCGQSHYRRGMCLSNMGELNEAIDAFQVCLEVEPLDLALSNSVISSIDKIISMPNSNIDDNTQTSSGFSCSSSDSEDSETDTLPPPSNCELESTNETSKNADNNNSSISREARTSDLSSTSKSKVLPNSEKDISSVENKADSKPSVKLKHGVPESLINEEDVECKLCYDILLRPVTTSCGHVFCKNCLLRTLDHNAVCPICRISLHEYLKEPYKPSTYLIEQLLELFFENQYNERRNTYSLRMRELSRVGIDENVEVPVFVCSIAFPYVKCPLHIFEPRYRLMIRECIESGSKRFGMCSKANENQIADIGAICEITKYQCLPDGRYIVQTTATQRFLIKEKVNRDSICYAKVTFFKDEPEDLSQEQFVTSSRRIYNQLSSYINSLTTSEQDCIFKALGMLPNYEENPRKYEHGVPWVWWGLAALPLNFTAKIVLLRSKCVSERMLSLQRFLKFLTRLNPGDSVANSSTSS